MTFVGSKKFHFPSETCTCKNSGINVTIDVELKQYNGSNQKYYDISYKYQFPGASNPKTKMCPHDVKFPLHEKKYKDHQDGECVAANEMTKQMINYLLMDVDELEKYSGTTTGLEYKIKIMKNLTLLWN